MGSTGELEAELFQPPGPGPAVSSDASQTRELASAGPALAIVSSDSLPGRRRVSTLAALTHSSFLSVNALRS